MKTFVKIFAFFFTSAIVVVFLGCLWRLCNGKDPFVSIRYLLDYINFYDGFEEINSIRGTIDSTIKYITDTITSLPSFDSPSLLDDVKNVVVYIFDLLLMLVNILLRSVFILRDLLYAFLDVISWVFGFLDYALAY